MSAVDKARAELEAAALVVGEKFSAQADATWDECQRFERAALEYFNAIRANAKKRRRKIDLEKLGEVTKAATQPGPWNVFVRDDGHHIVQDANGFWVADFGSDPDNSAFAAAFSPDVAAELLARARSS